MSKEDIIHPEVIGWRVGSSVFVTMIAIYLAYVISGFFVFSASFTSDNTVLTIVVSLILTAIFPKLILSKATPYIKEILHDLQAGQELSPRGSKDAHVIAFTLAFSLFGLATYLFAPEVLNTGIKNGSVVSTIIAKEISLSNKLDIIFADLMSVCGFMMFVSFGYSSWHRFHYPRYCSECNNTAIRSDNYCPMCGSFNGDSPSVLQRIRYLITKKEPNQISLDDFSE